MKLENIEQPRFGNLAHLDEKVLIATGKGTLTINHNKIDHQFLGHLFSYTRETILEKYGVSVTLTIQPKKDKRGRSLKRTFECDFLLDTAVLDRNKGLSSTEYSKRYVDSFPEIIILWEKDLNIFFNDPKGFNQWRKYSSTTTDSPEEQIAHFKMLRDDCLVRASRMEPLEAEHRARRRAKKDEKKQRQQKEHFSTKSMPTAVAALLAAMMVI